jgi:hypothetical protein
LHGSLSTTVRSRWMWWNVSNPYRSFGKRASKEKHCGVGRKTILTVILKFGWILIVEVKRYHSRPGQPSVTDPARRRARSAFCDRLELRHRRTSPRPAGRFCHRKCSTPPRHHRHRFCHRKCRGRFCRWIKMQNCHVRQTHAQTTWINIVDLWGDNQCWPVYLFIYLFIYKAFWVLGFKFFLTRGW